MECNKDEALRAKLIAEEKLTNREYEAARKFAVKAQTLYPGFDGISQMIATIDMYMISVVKPGEEVDWYEVLHVNQSADEETIKKSYRKLALVLHPDKNKTVGANGAFKILSEAFSLLSDNVNRLAYNQRRESRRAYQAVQLRAQTARYESNGSYNVAQAANQATQSAANGVKNRTTVPKAAARSPPNGTSANAGSKTGSLPKGKSKVTNKATKRKPAEPSQKPATFWTTCNHCKFHYEFVRMYLNGTLLCSNCKKPFMAKQTDPPPGYPATKVTEDDLGPPKDSEKNGPAVKRQRQEQNVPSAAIPGFGPNHNTHDLGKNVPSAANSSRPELNQNTHCPDKNVQAANKSGPVQAGLKSVRNANQAKVPHSRTFNVGSSDHPTGVKAARVVREVKRARAEGNVLVGSQEQKELNSDMANTNGCFGTGGASTVNGFSGARDISPLDYPKIMMMNARKDILIRLNAWKSEEGGSTEKHDGESDLTPNKAAELMIVPDPHFHDFDNDRMEGSFGDNEVWSAYDEKDGMPRLYALIHKVDCRKPFKLTVSWLNSRSNAEFSSMNWVSSGFHKTCGEYRVGKYQTFRSINVFSQKVNFSKTKRGSVLIFPQKDEVWALYRNWSSEWDKHTPKDVVEKYDMVIVLDDYNEEDGISVAPLVKVVGFRTVFHPDLDPHVIKRVPKEEMLRFSHRVPHHVLTGQEAQNAPKECLELDPAATALELLQVITEANKPVIPS